MSPYTIADGVLHVLAPPPNRVLMMFASDDAVPVDNAIELQFYPDGRVYRRGRLLTTDLEIVDGMRAVVLGAKA